MPARPKAKPAKPAKIPITCRLLQEDVEKLRVLAVRNSRTVNGEVAHSVRLYLQASQRSGGVQ